MPWSNHELKQSVKNIRPSTLTSWNDAVMMVSKISFISSCVPSWWFILPMGIWRAESPSRSRSPQPRAKQQPLARWDPSDSSSESSTSSSAERKRINCDLNFSYLASLKGASSDLTGDDGVFSANGANPERIRGVLKNSKSSGCKCNRQWFGLHNKKFFFVWK